MVNRKDEELRIDKKEEIGRSVENGFELIKMGLERMILIIIGRGKLGRGGEVGGGKRNKDKNKREKEEK